jgi:hypothetical protein
MLRLGLLLSSLLSLTALAVPHLDCSPAAARKMLRAMPTMGASSYAPGRYAFMRSTCGSAERGQYCIGRDYDEELHEPVREALAQSYLEGLRDCGVPQDPDSGRWQTGEIRCRPDQGATCRIFAPNPVPENWPGARGLEAEGAERAPRQDDWIHPYDRQEGDDRAGRPQRAPRRERPERESREDREEPRSERRPGRRIPEMPRIPSIPSGRRNEGSRPEQGEARVVILTDEPGARGAQTVASSFANVAPFSCMNIDVVIETYSRDELGCEPYSNGHPRIVICKSKANDLARRRQRELGAKRFLIVVDDGHWGGNGGSNPVVTTGILNGGPNAGLHELMHTMGFSDTYAQGEQHSVTGGDIMACVQANCYVPEEWWPRITRSLGVPANCN